MSELTPQEALKDLGQLLSTKLEQYKKDRSQKELQMLKDLRQYRAEYDPEVVKKLDPDRSQVYPRDTRQKVVGFTAKMMEMMFPASEKNWSLKGEEYPDISQEDLQGVIAQLEGEKAQAAQEQMMNQDPENPQPVQPEPITSEEIQDAVKDLAKVRAFNMENLIEDQLSELEIEYPHLCKKTVHAGGLYGWGLIEGPMTRWKTEQVWEQDEMGQWQATKKEIPRPDFEVVRGWDFLPDMSAKTWRQQEGAFRRHVFSRHDLADLAKRKDFLADAIIEYLKDHSSGNYKAQTYENELNLLDSTYNVSGLSSRRYEAYRWFGFISAKDIAAIGVNIPESELYKDLLVDIWFIDNTIIKAELAVFGDNVADQYHIYLYDDEDEAGLLGISLPQVIRDSQLKLCSVDRMTMDNAAASCGPILDIDEARLSRKQKDAGVQIHAFMSIYTDSDLQPMNNTPAVREIQINSHISELLALRKEYQQQLDTESNIQSWTMGNAQPLGEAFRTSQNMSQMTGGANMVTKDQVRAFDRLTSSIIGSIVKWNMKFIAPTRPEIRGAHDVIARGNISLVAKEVRGAALDQFMQTLTPEERAIIKTRDTLIERLKSRDLPTDIVEDDKTAKQILEQLRQAQAQSQQIQTENLQSDTAKKSADAQKSQAQAQEIMDSMNAKINALVAKAQSELTKAKGVKDAGQLNTIRLLLEQIGSTADEGSATPKGTTTKRQPAKAAGAAVRA